MRSVLFSCRVRTQFFCRVNGPLILSLGLFHNPETGNAWIFLTIYFVCLISKIGQKALVIITVAGAEKINKNALHLDWTNNEGKRFGTVPLVPRGKGSAHFSASFTPPSSPFKLKLRGKTKRGYSLERSSRRIVHPSHALIRVLYAKNEFTVPAGGRGFVLFVVYNTGPTEKFDIKIKNTMGFVHYLRRSSILVRRGRKSYFSVTFRAGSAAKRGKAGEVLATIKGQTSKKTVGQVVRLMVV